MSRFEISQGERAGWQWRAGAELAAILDTHPDLPIIGWMMGPAGATLVGRVNGLARAADTRRVFHSWRALTLTEHSEFASGGGTVHLRAAAERNHVRVALTAAVVGHDDQAVCS